MKKVTTLAVLLTLAIGASAQSSIKVFPNAHGKGVGPVTRPSANATNSTVNVPPVAKVPPVAVKGKKK